MMQRDYSLAMSLRSLAVFRNLLSDPVIGALLRFLDAAETDAPAAEKVDAYCCFAARLFEAHRRTLGGYVSSIVNDDENIFIRNTGAKKPVSPSLCESVERELAILQKAADLTPEALAAMAGVSIPLPGFETKEVSIAETYHHRCANIEKYGYGMFARYHMFFLGDNGEIIPVRNPDPISLKDLVDYQREQKLILDNAHALLAGKPAANTLLTGDAGTGKSSTVKAMVNLLSEEGLRLIEVRKDQLKLIPSLLDSLNENPLRFILFIDDLSFTRDDDNFSALKAILEGSVSARSRNVVIFATSNRRHMVKESFADREGDDIHRNDTMQELVSLSERFGLQITFHRPTKETYLNIVHNLAASEGITMPQEELDMLAERFVLNRGNRSARAARQFVDSLLAAE